MERLAVIVNVKARNASLHEEYLTVFEKNKLAYRLFKTDIQNLDKVIKQCQANYGNLLIGGGDGTVRSAAHLCANTKTTLGVLPLGTMNHFVKELELPNNPEELTQVILKKSHVSIDLAEVNGCIFINNASIGVYPLFAKKRDYYSKFYNKWLSYIPGIIKSFNTHKLFFVQMDILDRSVTAKTCFLMISNNLYTYEFPLSLKRENFHQGLLGIYLYKQGKLSLFKLLHTLFNRKENFEITQSEAPVTVYFKDKEKIEISLDGETLELKTPLLFRSRPGSLKVFKNL